MQILHEHKAELQHKGLNIRIAKVCALPRDIPGIKVMPEFPSDAEAVTDGKLILDDPKINTVIELMGGYTYAKTVVFEALSKGKNVVTANKALVAKFMPELIDILAKNPTSKFMYEAAVGGGIPIINALQTTYPPDSISRISGILNGTTNFMLSKVGCVRVFCVFCAMMRCVIYSV